MIRREVLLAPIAATSVLAGCGMEHGAGSVATTRGSCIEQDHSFTMPPGESIEIGISNLSTDGVGGNVEDSVEVANEDGDITFTLDTETSFEGDAQSTNGETGTMVTLDVNDMVQEFILREDDVVVRGTAALVQEENVVMTLDFDCPPEDK